MPGKMSFQLAAAEASLLFQVVHSHAATSGLDAEYAVLKARIGLDRSVRAGAKDVLENADTVRRSCLRQLLPGLLCRWPPEVREVLHCIGEFCGVQLEESRKTARSKSDSQKIDPTGGGDNARLGHRSDYTRPTVVL